MSVALTDCSCLMECKPFINDAGVRLWKCYCDPLDLDRWDIGNEFVNADGDKQLRVTRGDSDDCYVVAAPTVMSDGRFAYVAPLDLDNINVIRVSVGGITAYFAQNPSEPTEFNPVYYPDLCGVGATPIPCPSPGTCLVRVDGFPWETYFFDGQIVLTGVNHISFSITVWAGWYNYLPGLPPWGQFLAEHTWTYDGPIAYNINKVQVCDGLALCLNKWIDAARESHVYNADCEWVGPGTCDITWVCNDTEENATNSVGLFLGVTDETSGDSPGCAYNSKVDPIAEEDECCAHEEIPIEGADFWALEKCCLDPCLDDIDCTSSGCPPEYTFEEACAVLCDGEETTSLGCIDQINCPAKTCGNCHYMNENNNCFCQDDNVPGQWYITCYNYLYLNTCYIDVEECDPPVPP